MQSGKGKYMFGICKVGDRGQIVIPKEARQVFGIESGDSLILLGDKKKGLAIVKVEVFGAVCDEILDAKGEQAGNCD